MCSTNRNLSVINNCSHTSTSNGVLMGWDAIFSNSFDVVMTILQMFLCLIIFAGNTMSLLAVNFDKMLKKNIQNKYITSLASADQIIGMNMLQLQFKNYFMTDTLWLSCQPTLALIYTCTAVGLLNMLSIAIDRYFYIVHPFLHMRYVTGGRISVLIFVQWILAIVYGFVPIFVFNDGKSQGCNPFVTMQRRFVAFSHPIFFFIDCFGIGITYGLIAKVARQHMNKKTKRAQYINTVIVNSTKPTGEAITQSNYVGTVAENGHLGNVCVKKSDLLASDLISSITDSYNDVKKGIVIVVTNVFMKEKQVMSNNFDNNNLDTSKSFALLEGQYMVRNIIVEGNRNEANDSNSKSRNDLSLIKDNQSEVPVTNDTKSEVPVMKDKQRDVFLTNFKLSDLCLIDVKQSNVDAENDKQSNISVIFDNQSEVPVINYKQSDVSVTNNKNNDVFVINNKHNNKSNNENNDVEDATENSTGHGLEKSSEHTDQIKTKTETNSLESLEELNLVLNKPDISETDLAANEADGETPKNRALLNVNNTTNGKLSSGKREQVKRTQHQHPQQQLPQNNPWSLASLRWMKQMFVVYGLFVLCWAPSMVLMAISVAYEPSYKVIYILSMFGMSNSAVNFIVYFLYNPTYRTSIKNMFSCCYSRICRYN